MAAARTGIPRHGRHVGLGAALTLLVVCLLLPLNLSQGPGAATELVLFVDASSTCTAGCGSQTSPFSTIQAAIDQANGDIVAGTATSSKIYVAAGLYLERIFIYPDVNLIGA